jgi:hypothetical protein
MTRLTNLQTKHLLCHLKRSKGSGFRCCAATFYDDYDKPLCVSSFEGTTIGRALLRKSLQNKPEPRTLAPES